jgi:FAD/FMN-containing dehydrogenase
MSASIAPTSSPLDPAAIDELAANLRGALIRSGDVNYDEARPVWNGMIDRRPAAVARCRGVADVVDCVRFAASHELPLAVRGGGHNVAGFGTCDDGLVIDLSPMSAVRVDPERRTVRAEGGATWGDVDRETQRFGLAVPGGIYSLTGIAGLTLGGGQGWLRRAYGMSCDHLISADVVTAGGDLLVASESERSDLFWASRGGGGNFGVVTSFEYRLQPVGPIVAFAAAVYPVEETAEVMAAYRDFISDAPDELTTQATWWNIPAVPTFPTGIHNRPVIILSGASSGDVAEGMARLQPLRTAGTALLDLSSPLPYVALQQLFDPFFPSGERHYWKSLYLAELNDSAIAEIESWVARRPSPNSIVVVWPLGGAFARVPADATAAGDRDAPYLLEVLANWTGPEESERNVAWAQNCCAAMERFGAGKTNLNFPGLGEDPRFVRSAVGRNYDRLVTVKRRYDPTNLFRLNQNVDPRSPVDSSDGE